MHKLPQMTTIADLRNHHLHVFSLLTNGPVVINSRSLPVGVLLSPQIWDNLIQRLEDQQDIIDALTAKLARLEGKTEMLTQAEIDAWLADVAPAEAKPVEAEPIAAAPAELVEAKPVKAKSTTTKPAPTPAPEVERVPA